MPDWLSGPPSLNRPTPVESIEPAEPGAIAVPDANIPQPVPPEAPASELTNSDTPAVAVPESDEPLMPPPVMAEVDPQAGETPGPLLPTDTPAVAVPESGEPLMPPPVMAEVEPQAGETPGSLLPTDTPAALAEPPSTEAPPVAPSAEYEPIGADTSFMPPEEPFEDELEEAEVEEDDAVDPALFGGTPLGGAAGLSRASVSEGQATLQPADVPARSTETEGEPSASLAARERIALRIQGRPSGGMRNMIGLVLFSGLGLFIPYYGLSLISSNFNVLGITWLPGVKVPVRQSASSTDRERHAPAPSAASSDGKWPSFAQPDPSPSPKKKKK